MARVCGPILGFRGEAGGNWRLAVLVVHDAGTAPGALTHSAMAPQDAPVSPTALAEIAGLRAFAYDVALPVSEEDRTVDYRIDGEDRAWTVALPGRATRPRMAYASCNGFSQPGAMRAVGDKAAMWRRLLDAHAERPFHLLLLGGDQIYADQLWDALPDLRRFTELPRSERIEHRPAPGLADELLRFFAATYCDRFGQPAPAEALASIPTLMMWDDHDIFDGWGSYPDDEQTSPVFRAIFAAARRCFSVFQLQSDPDRPSWPALPGAGGFDALLTIRDIGLLVLDLRSERSQSQVLSPQSWDVVFDALDRAEGLKHLLVMSSIPMVHADLSFIEGSLDLLPGRQDLEDDLHDQWASYRHRLERLRAIHRLLDFAAAKGTRVTVLSGDVHVAALGVVQSGRRSVGWRHADTINQLTSSAIVHPPPPAVVRFFLERLSGDAQEIDRDVTARMLKFPGTNQRFVGARNWLCLDFDDRGRMWANWHVEDRPEPLTKVVHACEPEGPRT